MHYEVDQTRFKNGHDAFLQSLDLLPVDLNVDERAREQRQPVIAGGARRRIEDGIKPSSTAFRSDSGSPTASPPTA